MPEPRPNATPELRVKVARGPAAAHLAEFGIVAPRLHEGLVISGDRFVATAVESAALRLALPDALAVEMEGAAVAQVCADFGLPFALLRVDRIEEWTPEQVPLRTPWILNSPSASRCSSICVTRSTS